MAIANFFWHGNSLSLYERACIKSFVMNGFDVRVYTYNFGLNVPDGAKIVDASRLEDFETVNSYTQGGKKGCLAAFSDLFRYKVLSIEKGWWFDTDVFCLQSVNVFDELEQQSSGMIVGLQADNEINGAVIYVSNTDVANELYAMAAQKGKVLKWGDIGPTLIIEFASIHPEKVHIVSPDKFYPIHFDHIYSFYDFSYRDNAIKNTSNSLCVHLWNEVISRRAIPKEIYPPIDSYMYWLFKKTDESVSSLASLPAMTFDKLTSYAGIRKSEHKILNAYRKLRSAIEKLKNSLRQLK